MTYFPLAETHDTGTAYWESLGLLGGSTGMSQLPCSMPTVMVAPDGTSTGDTFTLTDSVYKVVGNKSGVSWNLDGDDGSTAYTKTLVVGYLHGNDTVVCGMGVSEDIYGTDYGSTDDWTNTLTMVSRDYTNAMEIFKWDGSSNQTILASDASIYSNLTAPFPLFGVALYSEAGSPGVQKGFVKFGSESQWFQIHSITETQGNQKSLMFFGAYYSSTARLVTPVMAWGVEA